MRRHTRVLGGVERCLGFLAQYAIDEIHADGYKYCDLTAQHRKRLIVLKRPVAQSREERSLTSSVWRCESIQPPQDAKDVVAKCQEGPLFLGYLRSR